MKKLLLLPLLLSSLLFADAKVYFGTGYTYNSETLTSPSKTITGNGARIKLGYGDRKAYAIELSLDYLDNNKEIFAPNDGKKYGFNVELLKAWDFGIYVNPYLKAGFGAGYLETTADTLNKSLTYGTFNLGAGVFIPLGEHFDIELAYEYKNVSYQKLDNNSTSNPKSSLHTGYVGVNFRF